MTRLFALLSIILLFVPAARPVTVFEALSPALPPDVEPGYQLNSEGDEWVWVDANQTELKPLAPPLRVQNESDAPPAASQQPVVSARVQAEAALGAALDRAREAGPQAVLDFVAAQAEPNHPLLQAAALDAQYELQASAPLPVVPAAPRVSLNSGPCTYDTIQAAINAAVNGDTVRVSAGSYTESLDVVGKRITIQGGYDATCTAQTGGLTTVTAGVAGSVLDVNSGAILTLRGLNLTGGSSFGAGVDVLGGSRVTLDNTDVHDNNGSSGAGLYISSTSVVTYTNDSDIYNNVSSSSGGGAIVYGKLSGFNTNSDIYSNSAVNGGGIAINDPGKLILDNADVVANTASQLGGGIFVSSAAITLTNSVFIGETAPCCQSAATGGGIYAQNSRVTLLGDANAILNNTATGNGGGVYLTNFSSLSASGGSLGYDTAAYAGNDAVLGAGMYTISSTVSYSGRIINNIASNSGGGIYADHSTLVLNNTTVGGAAANQHNQIGASGLNGAGMYLINQTHATLGNTTIISNTLSNTSTGYGGGMYVRAGSVVTMTNSSIQEHSLPSAFDGRGAAAYVYDSVLTLNNTEVLSNTTKNLGGGMRLFGTSTLNVLEGSVFRNNRALGGVGGAVAATNTPDINVTNAIFQHNSASTHGGAFYLDAGTLDFTGAWDVRYNWAGGNGGAIALLGTADASLMATGGPFTTYLAVNRAGANGGAVYAGNNKNVELYATNGYRLNLNTNTAGAHGGALYADAGAFFDIYGDIQATSNSAGSDGGMAYLSGGSRLWMDDYYTTPVQVLVNSADRGGAIFASDSPRVECDGAIFGLITKGNEATSGSGGAIYLSGSTFTADNCIFRNNQAQAGDGGAIAAYTSTVTIDVDYPTGLQSATRESGTASPAAPEATACDPRIKRCSSLYSNTASSDGGAIYSNAGKLVVNSTHLHRNTAQRGGAIYQEGAGATGVISNTLVYSNTSLLAFGAGIRVETGAMTIRHATLANNVGGAGYSPGAVSSHIYNTIIWGNSTAAFGSLTAAVCNIDQGGTAGPATDPLFFAPGGGEDYRPQFGSPAIDACTSGLPRDLRNTARPQGAKYDMGVFEIAVSRLYLPMVRK